MHILYKNYATIEKMEKLASVICNELELKEIKWKQKME